MIRFEDLRHWSMLPSSARCVCGDTLGEHQSMDPAFWRGLHAEPVSRHGVLNSWDEVDTIRDGRIWKVLLPRDEGREWYCAGECRSFEWRCTRFVEATPDQLEFAMMRVLHAKARGPERFRNFVRRLLDDLLDDEPSRFTLGSWRNEWLARREALGDYE